MTFDIGDKYSDRVQESESSARDVLTRDGDNERPGLVQKQREQFNHFKRSGASGITSEFGKPLIVDGMREHSQSPRRHPSDLSVRQLAHPDVSVILPADRSQQESRPGDAGALITMRENPEVKAVRNRLEHDIGRLPDAACYKRPLVLEIRQVTD